MSDTAGFDVIPQPSATLANAICAAVLADCAPSLAGVESLVRVEALALCSALISDLASASTRDQRRFLARWIPEVMDRGATLVDLRKYCRVVRQVLLAHDPTRSADAVAQLENWLFEFAFGIARGIVIGRENRIRAQQAQLEIQQAELATAEAERARLGDFVQEIWTPITPLYQGVLLVPLVGELSAERADALMSRLLAELARTDALFVLVDIAGVDNVDKPTAERITEMAGVVRISGARMVLVGIKPQMAVTIVKGALSVQQLITRSSLQAGLEWVLAQMNLGIAPIGRSAAHESETLPAEQ